MTETAILPDDELRTLCEQILAEPNADEENWAQRESDDMFQSQHYCGGFDATEMAFCFSRYSEDGTESWFQLTLSEVKAVAAGESLSVWVRSAE